MKVAILGIWHVHAGEYTEMARDAGATVTGVWDENPAWRNAFAEKYGIPAYASLDELLASDADAVIVCTATSAHTDCIVRAAKAGKDIFTEKVLALTEAECRTIEAAVNAAGVRFVISYPWKFRPGQLALKAAVDAGRIGRVNFLRFRNCHNGSLAGWLPAHFYNKEECGGGAMIDLGAHGMYLTEWLLGMPASAGSTFTVSCEAGGALAKNTDGVEDNAVTVMRFDNGAIAINETGFVSDCSPFVLEVHGEHGYVRMENDRVVKCTRATEHAVCEVTPPASLPSPIEQFLAGKVQPGCGIREAQALTHMMVMAYANVM